MGILAGVGGSKRKKNPHRQGCPCYAASRIARKGWGIGVNVLKQQGKLVVTGVWEAAVCVNSGGIRYPCAPTDAVPCFTRAFGQNMTPPSRPRRRESRTARIRALKGPGLSLRAV